MSEPADQPPGGVRVRDTRPRALGVHAAITVVDSIDELPTYVPRDLDAGLRAQVSVAADRGGFVLLVGASSTGKTRSLWEAVRAVLPDWWLVYPDGLDQLVELAAAPAPRTVVWLDELQTYFNQTSGPVGAVRRLLRGGSVLVGTLWSHEYSTRVALPMPDHPDPYEHDRKVLGVAEVVDVPAAFTTAERWRAEALAATDSRLRIALDTPDYGLTQVLAAGPELVRWWEHASDPYGKAIITAALDARRVGSRHPPTRELLAAAAAGYLTPAQRAAAVPDWVDHALAYATSPLRGAAAVLVPVGAAPGEHLGYLVADYLFQHAERVRRCVPLPDAAWQALVRYGHPDDLDRLRHEALAAATGAAQPPGPVQHPATRRAAGRARAAPLVVLTAVEIEYWAVRRQLSDLTPYRHPAGTIFEVGLLPGAPWPVAVAVTGPGNVGAGVLAERAIALFSPAALLFVGIAGALKEWVALGDIVVATRVLAYHSGREDRAGFHARPQSWEASHALEQTARHVARDRLSQPDDAVLDWRARPPQNPLRPSPAPPAPAVHFQPIAAGEVVLNSPSSPLAAQLRGQYDDAVAIEMESAGACAAAHLNGDLPMLTIRGISDSVHDVKEDTDRAGWPMLAAQWAALFAVRLIQHLDPRDL